MKAQYQPYQDPQRTQGMTLAAMLQGKPAFLPNPIQRRRDGQSLAHLLLTGRMPER